MFLGMRWNSLRTKIIAWSFVPTAIILSAVALVTFAAYQRVTEDLVIERNQEVARLSASQLATELTKYIDLLTAEARIADMHDDNPVTQQAALEEARNRLAIFDGGVIILNTRGILVASLPIRSEAFGQDWSNQQYFRQMLHYSAPIFSNITATGPGGSEVIVAAVPITGDQGEFLGVLAGMFRLGATSISALYGDIVKMRIEVDCCAFIVDGNGRAIYHSELEHIGENFSQQAVVEQALSGHIGAIRTRDLEGEDSVASFAPIPGTSWALITQESWQNLISAGRGYQRFLLVLLAMGVIVPGLVVAIGVRRITHPVAELISAAQDVAAGNFNQTIRAKTGDEIEDLARQFNQMSAQLQESYTHLEQRVAERTRELAALNAIAAVVSRSLNLEDSLADALDKTLEVTGIEAGGIYLLQEDGNTLSIAAHKGLGDTLASEIDHLQAGEGFSGEVVRMGTPLIVEDISADPRLTRLSVREGGFHALAVFPLIARGAVLGTLFVITREYRRFSQQSIDLITSIARQIGVAIENARLFKAEQRRAEQFRFISEVGRQIISILDTDELLVEIVRLLKETFGYYLITIGLIEQDQVVFKAGFKNNWPDAQFYPAPVRIGGQGITAWVAKTGMPLLAPDVSQEPRYLFWPDAAETRSELAVPLQTKAGVIGVLNVESDQVNAFDDSDVLVLQSIAHQAAIAIENARLFEQAQQLAVVQERQRLARDLHDSVTQALYGVTLYAEAAARQLSRGDANLPIATEHLHELQTTAQEALREMRLLVFELRPPVLEQEGLVAALRSRLEAVEGRSGLQVVFSVEGEPIQLSPKIEAGFYRIAQEALNNSLKHAQAHEITVSLRQSEGCVTLEVADDGLGFEPKTVHNQGGLGLSGMEERATEMGGRLAVESSLGHGTRVKVEVSQ